MLSQTLFLYVSLRRRWGLRLRKATKSILINNKNKETKGQKM